MRIAESLNRDASVLIVDRSRYAQGSYDWKAAERQSISAIAMTSMLAPGPIVRLNTPQKCCSKYCVLGLRRAVASN
jgi:hypothetical protein